MGKKELLINEDIRCKEVRVIDSDNGQLGVMPSRDALAKAFEKNLDLVMIAPQAVPPVCRIMDYGKYRFEQAKHEKEAKKKQKVIEVKEVQLSVNIDVHDFNTKLGNAERFLSRGDRVKVCVRFRGREMAHPELGRAVMDRFAEACSAFGTVEKMPVLEGRSLIMYISSKPNK